MIEQECWDVAIGNHHSEADPYILASYSNGDLRMFDVGTGSQIWTTNLNSGVVAAKCDRADIEMNKFTAVCMNSQFHTFNARTRHASKVPKTSSETSLIISLPDSDIVNYESNDHVILIHSCQEFLALQKHSLIKTMSLCSHCCSLLSVHFIVNGSMRYTKYKICSQRKKRETTSFRISSWVDFQARINVDVHHHRVLVHKCLVDLFTIM